MDVKKLAQKIEAAQLLLDEIRKESGCEAFGAEVNLPHRRQETALETAERAYEERRRRAAHFKHDAIFGEPAWDILLDLYIHQGRNEEVTVKSAVLGSGAMQSTALRWLTVLDREGLIYSEECSAEDGRYLLRLTPGGYESITRYLAEIAR